MRSTVLLFSVLIALEPAAAGDLYRCVAADGSVRFTDDPSGCPGAEKHEIQKVLTHSAPGPSRGAPRGAQDTPPAAPAPGIGGAEAHAHAADEATWRGKKETAERELEQARQAIERAHTTVERCNRHEIQVIGDDKARRLEELCTRANEELATNTERTAELERYLEEGLADECRAAGCLPGWIR
jgi:hypothetical protein